MGKDADAMELLSKIYTNHNEMESLFKDIPISNNFNVRQLLSDHFVDKKLRKYFLVGCCMAILQ